MVVVRGPDGGPLPPVRIEPADFHTVAQRFVDAGTELHGVLPTLFRVLSGFRGPAGVDGSARDFDAAYHPAVLALVDGVNRAVGVLGDIGLGIDTSARNHWNADADATPGGGAPLPWSPVDPGLVLPVSLSVPTLVGSPTLALPTPLSGKVPLGHIDDLRTIADAFRAGADTIESVSAGLHNDLEFLFSNNQSADLDALDEFWDRVGGSGDTAILTALRNGCGQLADALGQYADWIGQTQDQIVDAIGDVLKDATLGAIGMILLAALTDGIGAIADIAAALDDAGDGAALVAAVDGVLTVASGRLAAIGAVATGAVGAMTTAINSTPDPNINSADPESVTDAQEQTAAKNLADRGGSDDVGAARELKVAELTNGTVPSGEPGSPGTPIVQSNVGRSDVDVVGGDGSFIQVGGPAKAKNLAKFGQKVSILKSIAAQAGVRAQVYLEEGTPESVLNIARRQLGSENVHTFPKVGFDE